MTKPSRRKCWLAAGFCTDVFSGRVNTDPVIGVGVLTSVPGGMCSCASNMCSSEGRLVASSCSIYMGSEAAA